MLGIGPLGSAPLGALPDEAHKSTPAQPTASSLNADLNSAAAIISTAADNLPTSRGSVGDGAVGDASVGGDGTGEPLISSNVAPLPVEANGKVYTQPPFTVAFGTGSYGSGTYGGGGSQEAEPSRLVLEIVAGETSDTAAFEGHVQIDLLARVRILETTVEQLRAERRTIIGPGHNNPPIFSDHPETDEWVDELIELLKSPPDFRTTSDGNDKLRKADGLIVRLQTKLIELLDEAAKGAAKKLGELAIVALFGALAYVSGALTPLLSVLP